MHRVLEVQSPAEKDLAHHDVKRVHVGFGRCVDLEQQQPRVHYFRRDEIDSSQYPVFHQMEGVLVFEDGEVKSDEEVQQHLKDTLGGMVAHLFQTTEMRWIDAYFSFTDPSLELEVYFKDDWLEVLGSGVIQPRVLKNAGLEGLRE